MVSVGIVSVHYYEGYVPASVRAVADLADRAQAQSLIFVANAPELLPALHDAARRASGRHVDVLLHDNSGLEFGAYEAGLRHLDRGLDWVVFANDTYSVHECFSSVQREHLLAALKHPGDGATAQAVGHVASIARSLAVADKRTHRWLTTNIFALDRRALQVLGNQLYFPKLDALIRARGTAQEFFSHGMDQAMVEHITAWLFSTDAPYSWYAAEPLTPENAERFAKKARAILQEKYISAILEEAGAWILDIDASNLRQRLKKRAETMIFDWSFASARSSRRRRP